jgi:hypothetical protein
MPSRWAYLQQASCQSSKNNISDPDIVDVETKTHSTCPRENVIGYMQERGVNFERVLSGKRDTSQA